MTTYRTLTALVFLLASPAFGQPQHRDNPTVKETLRWMQTSLESGSGDYWVGHEVRSLRLNDFAGCRVHFSASTHQEPFPSGEPAPDKKPTRIDYFFELGDIDPANITFSKGPSSNTEVPSFITIRTRNDEKKVTSRYSWLPEVGAKPDDSSVIFAVEAFGSDNDYVVRFARAFKHAVEACGGKPSFFADSDRRHERTHPAPSGVAAQSVPSREDIPSIAKAANGAVVSIVMSDKNGNPIAQGSGFLVSRDGLIVTNYHVIAQGISAVVKLPDGAFFAVDGVVAFDKARDVALIKAHGEDFRMLTLGNSDRVEVGQEVVAIGNPLSLESTVSNGIVSGIRTDEDLGGKFLQVTTPISPGSSGGPLFNMAGDVIGITTLYLKGGENLNFAIPINDVKRLLLQANSAKLQNFPNEHEPVEAQKHDEDTSSSGTVAAAHTAPTARDYYKQLYEAGGFSGTLNNGYVCFEDDGGEPGSFFAFWAYGPGSASGQEISQTPYVDFANPDALHDLTPDGLADLRQGRRLMQVYFYLKGVQTGSAMYYWHEDEDKWVAHYEKNKMYNSGTPIKESETDRISIEPITLRYARFFQASVTVGSGDTAVSKEGPEEDSSGGCEKILARQ
jgi:S1-C subfamily serine protease